ncbi:MAG TPA: M13 family metallopeptidase N-terminal domain-containing protein, partial [Pseudoxanthomonas sp.]|nr:M13 family metallopeptidase N-terminal domain-containing protein [Pseudoxanthomonas sp.]
MKLSPSSLGLACALGIAAFSASAADPAGKPQLGDFGVDLSARDASAKPGDDFNRYASGRWIDSYVLKDYESNYGSFNELRDRTEEQVHGLIEGLQAQKALAPGGNGQKVRDYYASYMDRAARDAAGIAPLQPVLARIAAIDTKAGLVAAFGNDDIDGSDAPLGLFVSTDRKDPDRYLVGLGV